MKQIIIIVLAAALGAALMGADYYPATSRFGYFEPNVRQGVVGGIPTRSGGNTINATDYGFATGASAATNAAAVTSALAASSEGDIIYLASGAYQINTVYVNRDYPNRTIRGAGIDSTILVPNGGAAFVVGDTSDYGSVFNPSTTVTSMSANSNSITVSDGSSFPSPSGESQYRVARIQLANEAVTPVMSTGGTPKARAITVVLTARSGNTMTLLQALPSAFADGASGAVIELARQNAWSPRGTGIEDMTIDADQSPSPVQSPLQLTMVFNSWVKNVKIFGHANYGLNVYDSSNIEVRKVYIGLGRNGVNSNGAGILWNYSTYGLIEDNIIVGSSPEMEINFGSTSNIIAYNYLNTGILNFNHGPHNSYNLFEGNSYWYAQSDGYFGGSSEETHFRNWMRSGVALVLKRLTRNNNMVGNIIGVAGETYPKDYSDEWGLPNINNLSSSGTWGLSASSYSVDWDSSNSRPYYWTGTLTTRTSNTQGVVTLDSGMISSFNTALANAANSKRAVSLADFVSQETVTINSVSGSDVTFTTDSVASNLPATSTVMWFSPGVNGFQEKDLDVENTTIRKANYYVLTGNIPAGEALGGDTLPNSYYHTSKPSWFGNLAWPAYDPSNPPASEAAAKVAIPAGYRYINGNSNYLGTTGGISINGTLTVTGTITLE